MISYYFKSFRIVLNNEVCSTVKPASETTRPKDHALCVPFLQFAIPHLSTNQASVCIVPHTKLYQDSSQTPNIRSNNHGSSVLVPTARDCGIHQSSEAGYSLRNVFEDCAFCGAFHSR